MFYALKGVLSSMGVTFVSMIAFLTVHRLSKTDLQDKTADPPIEEQHHIAQFAFPASARYRDEVSSDMPLGGSRVGRFEIKVHNAMRYTEWLQCIRTKEVDRVRQEYLFINSPARVNYFLSHNYCR